MILEECPDFLHKGRRLDEELCSWSFSTKQWKNCSVRPLLLGGVGPGPLGPLNLGEIQSENFSYSADRWRQLSPRFATANNFRCFEANSLFFAHWNTVYNWQNSICNEAVTKHNDTFQVQIGLPPWQKKMDSQDHSCSFGWWFANCSWLLQFEKFHWLLTACITNRLISSPLSLCFDCHVTKSINFLVSPVVLISISFTLGIDENKSQC